MTFDEEDKRLVQFMLQIRVTLSAALLRRGFETMEIQMWLAAAGGGGGRGVEEVLRAMRIASSAFFHFHQRRRA